MTTSLPANQLCELVAGPESSGKIKPVEGARNALFVFVEMEKSSYKVTNLIYTSFAIYIALNSD